MSELDEVMKDNLNDGDEDCKRPQINRTYLCVCIMEMLMTRAIQENKDSVRSYYEKNEDFFKGKFSRVVP
eukprot:13469463-Ditylum_brightwellii.AAC.1